MDIEKRRPVELDHGEYGSEIEVERRRLFWPAMKAPTQTLAKVAVTGVLALAIAALGIAQGSWAALVAGLLVGLVGLLITRSSISEEAHRNVYNRAVLQLAAATQERDERIGRLEARVRELEETRPKLMLTCRDVPGGLLLDVTNTGASAAIWCKVRVLSIKGGRVGEPQPHQSFIPVWSTGQRQATIPTGDNNSLVLARLDQSGVGAVFPYIRNGDVPFSLSWHAGVSHVAPDGSKTPEPVSRAVLEVTVVSDPPPLLGGAPRRYAINAFAECEELA